MDTKENKNEKKPTNAQLQRRIDNAILHIGRTKDTKSVFFDDKMLRLTVDENEGVAIVETGGHRHVFSNIVGSSISRPYIYVMRFVDLAIENEPEIIIKDKNNNPIGKSYEKLLEILEKKENDADYVIAWYIDKWFFNIYNPLYDIDDTEVAAMVVYETYCHNIARSQVFLEEHKEDLTKKQYIERIIELEKSFTEGITDDVMIKALSDEDRLKQEMEAIERNEQEQMLEASADGEEQGK